MPDPFDPKLYATNEEFKKFFADRGIAVENVRIEPVEHRRRFNVAGLPPMFLEMDTSAADCLRIVRTFIKNNR